MTILGQFMGMFDCEAMGRTCTLGKAWQGSARLGADIGKTLAENDDADKSMLADLQKGTL